jgi:hypothetical protein
MINASISEQKVSSVVVVGSLADDLVTFGFEGCTLEVRTPLADVRGRNVPISMNQIVAIYLKKQNEKKVGRMQKLNRARIKPVVGLCCKRRET